MLRWRGEANAASSIQQILCVCVYLIPAVGSVRGVDEQGDDLGLGQEGSSTPRGLLGGEVVCALLKQEVCGNIRRHREKVHVPEAADREKVEKKNKIHATPLVQT